MYIHIEREGEMERKRERKSVSPGSEFSVDDQFLQNGFPRGQVEKVTDFFGAFTANGSILWNREFGQTRHALRSTISCPAVYNFRYSAADRSQLFIRLR